MDSPDRPAQGSPPREPAPSPGSGASGRRAWWAPAPDPVLPPISRRRAYTEVLLVFAAFFLAGVVAAALLLGDRYRNLLQTGSWAAYSPQVVDLCTQIGLAVAVVLLLASRRGVSAATLGLRIPRLDDGRVAISRSVRIAAWALVALIAGGILNAALQTGHLPTGTPNAPELIFGVVDSFQAGIVEELVVLAFVVVTLRQAGRPWWEVTVAALVLRGSYHIYYGPGVFGILLWAAIYYWTYLRFRELVPLMVCHAGWDVVGFLSQRWAAVTGVAMLVVLSIWMAAVILWLVERNNRSLAGSTPAGWPAGGWGAGGAPGGWSGSGAGGWPRGGSGAGGGGWPRSGGWPGPADQGRTAAPTDQDRPTGPATPPNGPPPGWHPDPAGHNRWRWWDGERWTEHVSSHG